MFLYCEMCRYVLVFKENNFCKRNSLKYLFRAWVVWRGCVALEFASIPNLYLNFGKAWECFAPEFVGTSNHSCLRQSGECLAPHPAEFLEPQAHLFLAWKCSPETVVGPGMGTLWVHDSSPFSVFVSEFCHAGLKPLRFFWKRVICAWRPLRTL